MYVCMYGDNKDTLEESINFFRNNIYEYCDNYVGSEVLFKRFTYLWPYFENEITPQDLTHLTDRILYGLEKEEVIKKIEKPDGFDSPYARYEILKHGNLLESFD